MAGDKAREGRGQVGVRVDAVQFAGLDQGGDHRLMLGTAVRAREERILATEGERPDGPLDDIGVDLQATICEVEGVALIVR